MSKYCGRAPEDAPLVASHPREWVKTVEDELYDHFHQFFGWKERRQPGFPPRSPPVMGALYNRHILRPAGIDPQVIKAIRRRCRRKGLRLHQFLNEEGLRRLKERINYVVEVARLSVSLPDFKSRLAGQLPLFG